MVNKDLTGKIVDSILKKDFGAYFNSPHTDVITNEVRTRLEELSTEDQKLAKRNMEEYLIEICQTENDNAFLIKENLIYYLERSKDVNYPLLKDLYFRQSNPYLKLNLFFGLLPSFDEEVESDFINNINPGNEYDILIRSWTMAFFANAANPYEYIDNGVDDPSEAIRARLNRFVILLDKDNKKYLKALAYLLIDLIVVWLFINSRGHQILNDDDYEVVKKIPEHYEKFSKHKNEEIIKIKNKIINIR